MPERWIAHLAELVTCQTTVERRDEIERCFEVIKNQLADLPLQVSRYEEAGEVSMVWSSEATLTPDICLCAHIDVVPASEAFFTMDQKAGRLTGRGVSDMKFAVVCFAEAIRTILAQTPDDHPSFCIMLTSDEERGGFHGVDYLVNRVGYRPKVVIIPDGGDNWHIVEKAKGARLIEITLPGRAAHASRPWEGTSAIDAAAELVHTINQLYPNPQEASWHTSHNFGKITGGTAGNQVADSATLWLDIRYTEELPADIIQAKVAQHFPQAQTQVIVDKPFFTVDRHHPAVQLWAQLLRAEVATTPQVDAELFQFEGGSADHHYFSQHHIPVIVSKPEGGLIHTEAEWMSVEGIAAFTRVLTQFMLTYKG